MRACRNILVTKIRFIVFSILVLFSLCTAYYRIFQAQIKGPENKDADLTVMVTAQLICIFVLINAKCRFSHEAAHIRVIEPEDQWSCKCSPDILAQ